MSASMKRYCYVLFVATAVLCCAKSTGDAGAMEVESPSEIPPGSFRAIIGLRDPVAPTDSTLTPEQIEALADSVAGRHGLRVERVLTLISAFTAIVDSSALRELRADTCVRYVEQDRVLRPSRDTAAGVT